MADNQRFGGLELRHGLLSGDSLTQVLREIVDAGNNSGAPFSLMLLNLKEYSTLSHLYGSETADRLLEKQAHKLLSDLPDDILAGYLENGDLVVIDPHPAISCMAGVLVEAAAENLEVDGHPLAPTVRAGIVFCPTHGTQLETLIRRARLAASNCNHTGLQAYTPAMEQTARHEFALHHELIGALESGQFLLQFQPQCRLRDLTIERCEALVRWRHPEHGLLMPGDFIDVFERNGCIHRLGKWVLDQACRQLAAWRRTGLGPQRMSINFSPSELQRPGFADAVMHAIQKHGVDPSALILEITESVAMRDPRLIPDKLRELRTAGIRLAIDDFGAGYSSLSALQHLQADHLKLDRSLIEDLPVSSRAKVLAKSAIDLGHGLGMQVVAEGIETEAQRQILLDLHCDAGQGFLLGPPLGPVAIQAQMRQTSASNSGFRYSRMLDS